MAQFETIGSGYSETKDRKVIRKAIIATGGQPVTVPPAPNNYALSNINVVQQAAGVLSATFEYTQGGDGQVAGGGASYSSNRKRVEITGGTREVPILTRPQFKDLTIEQIQSVQKAVDERQQRSFTNETQQQLYSFLSRGIEYWLAPAVVGRIIEFESNLPSLEPIAKVANPPELDALPETFWICTAITASPIGNRYEVVREYTLNFSAWEDVEALYNWS